MFDESYTQAPTSAPSPIASQPSGPSTTPHTPTPRAQIEAAPPYTSYIPVASEDVAVPQGIIKDGLMTLVPHNFTANPQNLHQSGPSPSPL